MLAAIVAEFLQAQAVFDVLLIFRCLVIAMLAIAASQRHQSLIFRGHHFLFPKKPPTRIELVTASLPMRCSTDELQGQPILKLHGDGFEPPYSEEIRFTV